jgi:hypothetical protein
LTDLARERVSGPFSERGLFLTATVVREFRKVFDDHRDEKRGSCVFTTVVRGSASDDHSVEKGGFVLTTVVSRVGCSMTIVELIEMELCFNHYSKGCLGCGISTVVPGRRGLWGGGRV